MILGQAGETDGDLPREHRRRVQHHQAERTAPQKHVRTPRTPFGLRRPDDPEAPRTANGHPIAWRQGPRSIHVRHPPPVRDGAGHQLPDECRFPTPARPHDLGEPAARQPSGRQRLVERGDPRSNRHSVRSRWSEECVDLLAERGE